MNRPLKAAITAAFAVATLAFVAPVANASPASASTEVQAVAPTLQSMPIRIPFGGAKCVR